jgi:phosphatidylinositol alpha-1,6-mannosyltransferase
MNAAGKILLVANNFPPTRGGSAVVYASLAQHLGAGAVVLAPKSSYADGLPLIGWREHDRRAPYRVQRLHLLRTRLNRDRPGTLGRLLFLASDVLIRIRLTAAILRLVATGRVRTVCVGELLASGWVIALCRWIPTLRTVVYVHGEEITTEDGYDRGHRRARKALLAADAIIVVSRFTETAVQALLGPAAPPGRIRLIENGVDTGRFRPIGRRADLMELYHLDAAWPVFVSVCRLLEKKGIDQAIRAFAELAKTHPEARYLIVGTGSYEAALRAIARECGVQDRVIFAGDVTDDDLVAHYCLGDVFVMPNRELANGDTEGFGLVFLEANSCGLPVIAGRDGGSQDAVQDGVNGLVVDGTSVAAIAAAMTALLDDPALAARLKQGATTISQAADWRRKTETFLQACEQLHAGGV